MMRPNTVSCSFANLAVAAMALRKVAPTLTAESETPDYLSANISRSEKSGGLGAWRQTRSLAGLASRRPGTELRFDRTNMGDRYENLLDRSSAS
jgi:hypothetical protein